MSYKLAAIALLAMAMYAAGARADDSDPSMFSFSGFGTLGMVHTSETLADFTSSSLKPIGAGYSRDWSADVDSVLGAQVTANITPRLSAVVQLILEQRYDNTYVPTVEWAYIKYEFTSELSVRGGRFVLPSFLVSDYRKVGYANPWVRPPVEVYSLVPISFSDGVDGSYRVYVGEFANTLQGFYGNSETKLPRGGGTAKAKDAWGLSYTAEYGFATAHVAYQSGRVTLDSFDALFDGFRQFGPAGIALADKYDVNNKVFTFIGVGASYDPGSWFVMGEWGMTESHSVLGKRSAWYGSAGYRIEKFTPYVTYAQANGESSTSDSGLELSALPPYLAGPGGALNAGLNAVLGLIPVQKTVSVGVRWDFAKNMDLKLQFDRTRLGPGSAGTLINVQPGFQPGGRFSVFSATFDFVF